MITFLHNNEITKRHFFVSISLIFDPFGLVSPRTMEAKLIMWKMWIDKYDWDSETQIYGMVLLEHCIY